MGRFRKADLEAASFWAPRRQPDPTITEPQKLSELLTAPPEDFLECYAVSREMNSVRMDQPDSAERIDVDYSALLNTP